MERKLSPSDMGIVPVNKKNRVVSLPLTAPPLMAGLKVEDIVSERLSGSGAELCWKQLVRAVADCQEYACMM